MRSPIPIFDCHGHLGTHPDFPAWKQSPEDMLQVMEKLGLPISQKQRNYFLKG
jgi:hypothetical protein